MVEPGWVNGDDIARGFVEECPECGNLSLRHDACEECGYTTGVDPDYYYDMYRDEIAWLTEEDDNA